MKPVISTTCLTFLVVLAIGLLLPAAQAQTYTVLHNFTGGQDGANPYAGVTIDRAGNLYGTAYSGGSGSQGTVYELKPRNGNWTLDPLYSFCSELGCTDGAHPESRVVFSPQGILYGTTNVGGVPGYGIVFQLRPPATAPHSAIYSWTETVLYSFTNSPDGSHPGYGDVIFDQANNIYDTTIAGGQSGSGTVYELTPSGTESVLYSFSGLYGVEPYGSVVFDNAGNLYGTTYAGGNSSGGTAFELTYVQGIGWEITTLADFGYNSAGDYPWAGLIYEGGNLYGTTSDTGPNNGGGTVFELMRLNGVWTEHHLFGFTGVLNGNCGPRGILAMDAAGNLYGTTYCDGTGSCGNVFELSPSNGGWTYSDLHDFTCGTDGGKPISNVAFDTAGNLYGTASVGGNLSDCGGTGCGVVWEITP